ncbi:alpha/beta fold hydrolase [Nocardia sp. NPDC051787]|uniref:alpha/beta hydrolase n=1 Tax=Nocardia sp. NPDC051787 TaxID=3155415 RepID=UPI00344121C8
MRVPTAEMSYGHGSPLIKGRLPFVVLACANPHVVVVAEPACALARAEVPEARVRVLMIHGAGGHAGLLWPFAAVAAHEGVEAMAVDLPLYGDTVEPRPRTVRYRDWVDLLTQFVCAETESDDRPLVLFGASMGGMLAYEAAARTRAVAHVVGGSGVTGPDPALTW